MSHCKTCKHWEKCDNYPKDFGCCNAEHCVDDKKLMFTESGYGDGDGVLYTKPEFGCILWSKNDNCK